MASNVGPWPRGRAGSTTRPEVRVADGGRQAEDRVEGAPAEPGAGGLLEALDHVGVAVDDLEAAIRRQWLAFGQEPVHRERVEADGVEEVLFRVGESYLQFLSPLRDDSPVARFLVRRGPGLHHLAYRVADCDAALAQAAEAGLQPIDAAPRAGSRGTRVAFLHPASTGGVLIELVEQGRGGPDGRPTPTRS